MKWKKHLLHGIVQEQDILIHNGQCDGLLVLILLQAVVDGFHES